MKKPDRVRVLHSNSVYTTKKHADGSVERYKGRLVASGNEQSYSVDYTDTFLSVLGMTTGKVIFALAHIWGVPATCRMRMEISKEKLAELGVQHKRELVLRLKESICLYYKRDGTGVTLVGTSEARVDELFSRMVVVKNLGVVFKFLGIGLVYEKDSGGGWSSAR
ncbi:hypothetical protein PR001_g24500 [Phytophthora rubi]|uniref:Reverse transcriptase Ty1/copia-type domain-containing protein n=1 Tax=Phytophthora rubi TaxID=129364 RepID=A0A6A3IHK1_9STRA|nr:hypothetical protein PR001_g24500 [Phytophthora rubi]